MSLRLRVGLAAAISALLVVVVAGSALVALLAADERGDLDDRLRAQSNVTAQRAAVLLLSGRGARPDERSQRLAPDLNTVARIWIDDGVAETVGAFPLPEGEPLPRGFTSRRVDGERWRFLRRDGAEAAARPGGTVGDAFERRQVAVEVALPTTEAETTVADTRRLVLRLGLAAVTVAGFLGWLLAGAALRPLARLRHDAERVSGTDDLEVRVADAQGLAEVDELGATINRMLERIAMATRETRVALEASRAFAGNAAHELRTPLTSMQANLEVLQRNPELDPGQRTAITADVMEQQQRLLRLLGALRLLARGDLAGAPFREDVDLAALTEDAARRARDRHPGAEITVDLGETDTTLAGWDEGLQVLVDNLIDNAIVHGRDPRGRVRVEVALARAGGEVVLRVDDHGPGIPAEERAQVLERFGRGRNPGGPGSGLGLALVDQQARLHGGRVEIGDRPGGEGARVVVHLAVPAPTGPGPTA